MASQWFFGLYFYVVVIYNCPCNCFLHSGLYKHTHCGQGVWEVVNWCSVFLPTLNQWSVKTALDG